MAVAVVTVSALVLLNASPLLAQSGSGSSNETAFGLNTTTFDTPHGKVKVNLPDDATAGDTLSGTVFVQPSGKTAKEQAKNGDELNGYVVEVQNKKTQVGKKVLEFGVPATAGVTYLVLRDRAGNEVSTAAVPIKAAQTEAEHTATTETAATKTATGFHLPTVSQAGRPLNIPGPFDGNSITTDVKIGGEKAEVLAESPRKTTVQAPSDAVGLQPIHVQKGSAEADGELRNLGIKLSSPDTKILKDGTTKVSAEVRGLDGLKTPISFKLVNRSEPVVSLEGGDDQTITIQPEDVRPGGVYTVTRTLTGKGSGNFTLIAMISDESMPEYGGNVGAYAKGPKEGQAQKCENCVANNNQGPGTFDAPVACTAASTCVNNNNSLLWDAANGWCSGGKNAEACSGDCGSGYHCNGIYDRANSNGLSVTASVVPGNPLKCKGAMVTCNVTVNIAAGGQLACKCSCNPN
ncbi:MAG: hypothetical protein ABSC47_00820 [Terracidiphilus sp.]